MRRRSPRWHPPLGQSLRMVLKPAIAFLVFTILGFAALLGVVVFESGARDLPEMLAATGAGIAGLILGQLIAVQRFRALPIFIAGSFSIGAGIWLVSSGIKLPELLLICIFFFAFAFPCGMLSLQHRWDLFASFWPAVGWIGAAVSILNRQHRITAWEEEKVAIWTPIPLILLFAFLVLWLFYLAAKQSLRVELWQALSGTAARRISKRSDIKAIPRRNVLPILVIAAALFVITAVLAPYLWRTGKGDKGDDDGKQHTEEPDRTPKVDGDRLAKMLQQIAEGAKSAALNLWPLLFLLLLYRPAKRALLKSHLVTPIVPTPPTERIENLWEYVRIAAEDANVVPIASDSVEQLMKRVGEKGFQSVALARAADIYSRTRYGFTVAPGDPLAMREHAVAAARELTANLSTWDRLRNWWRPLS